MKHRTGLLEINKNEFLWEKKWIFFLNIQKAPKFPETLDEMYSPWKWIDWYAPSMTKYISIQII